MTQGALAGAILAGGAGRRLGSRQKALITIDGVTVLERQLAALRPHVGRVFVVANDPAPFAPLGLEVVADAVPGQGPLQGLLAACEHADADAVLVLACDLPFVADAVLEHLVARAPGADVVLPIVAGRPEPLVARYARRVAAPIRAALAAGERRATAFHAAVQVERVSEAELRALDPELRSFINVNTPEVLAALNGR